MATRRPSFWRLPAPPLAVAAALGLTCAPAATGSTPGAPFEFRPGVMVDPREGVTFLMDPRGGITAVDLRDGTSRWRSDAAAKPLALDDERIFAQTEPRPDSPALEIGALDRRNPQRFLWRAAVDVPEIGVPSLADTAASSFSVRAWKDEDALVVSWHSIERPLRGTQGMPGDVEATVRTGGVRIDRRSGAVTPLDGAVVAPAAPDAAGPEPGSRVLGDYTVRYPSADGRHLLASRGAGEGGFNWVILELPALRRVASLESEQPGAWFFLWGALLVHETQAYFDAARGGQHPPGLRAVDVHSGRELWAYPYRDLRHRGELVPAMPTP